MQCLSYECSELQRLQTRLSSNIMENDLINFQSQCHQNDGGYNVLLGNPSKLCLLVYWYSDNWTNNATWCTSKSCNAGLQFLIFDIYFAHTICSNLSGVWLVFSKQILFGPLPITEGKSLGSALYIASHQQYIREALLQIRCFLQLVMILQKSVFGHWFWEKFNFFGLRPNTRAGGWRSMYCCLTVTYQRSLFMNLLPSHYDFA